LNKFKFIDKILKVCVFEGKIKLTKNIIIAITTKIIKKVQIEEGICDFLSKLIRYGLLR